MHAPTRQTMPATPGLPSRSEFADWLNVGINEIPRLLRPFGPTPIEGDLPARSIRRPLLAVELADEARKRGRRRIRENKSGQKLKLSARES
ncbi:hypothetical protein [uncultured Amaricoccus sp.]|uniref:hypothetical protein n=1 Tax=uncultured Amaricoccus sp. TaxID=339341 RepID=UPI0026281BCC|nr:hypothetical protein [uncultured Amaricoccus sp.]